MKAIFIFIFTIILLSCNKEPVIRVYFPDKSMTLKKSDELIVNIDSYFEANIIKNKV